MGMFDTLVFQHKGKRRATQVKWAGQALCTYELGDRIGTNESDAEVLRPFDVYIEEFGENSKPLWLVVMLHDFRWVDYRVTGSLKSARAAGQELIQQWSDPACRAGKLADLVKVLADERVALHSRLLCISSLLSDYYHWSYVQEFPRKKTKESRLMQKAFGPFRDYSTQPFDRWLAAELKDQLKAQTKCSDGIDVDYYYNELLRDRAALKDGQKGSDEG